MSGSPRHRGRIDIAKVRATTDEDIARQIAEDPDTAPDASDFLEELARLREAGEPLPPGVRIVRPNKSKQKAPA